MVDNIRRKQLALHLRRLSVGIISNDEFESNIVDEVTDGWLPEHYHRAKKAKNGDAVIIPMLELCWGLYSDTENHRLTGKHKIPKEGLKTIARCILFLQSELEYEWPYFHMNNPLFKFSIKDLLATVITLGMHYRKKRAEQEQAFKEFQELGDYEYWPFFKKTDYKKQLNKPQFLTGYKAMPLIFILIAVNLCKAQNIYSELHLNEQREFKTVKPKKIIETNVFYTSEGKKIHKEIKLFDSAGMLITNDRFDEDGTLSARLTYVNDTSKKITLSRTFERWGQLGHTSETTYYQYDTSSFLTSLTSKNEQGGVIMFARLTNNQQGNPTELFLFDGNGNAYGKEVAQYLYDRNQAVTSVISNDGRTLSIDTIKISFVHASLHPIEGEVYNERGDLISWQRLNKNYTYSYFEEEYQYDGLGNCNEDRIYKVVKKNNGKKDRTIDRIFKKEYSY